MYTSSGVCRFHAVLFSSAVSHRSMRPSPPTSAVDELHRRTDADNQRRGVLLRVKKTVDVSCGPLAEWRAGVVHVRTRRPIVGDADWRARERSGRTALFYGFSINQCGRPARTRCEATSLTSNARSLSLCLS